MNFTATVRYYGWSSLSITAPSGSLYFDPFFRPYCGAQWSKLEDYLPADVVCVTHGHEEHFLDTPEVVRRSGAAVVSSRSVCRFLERRRAIAPKRLHTVACFEPIEIAGFRITAFEWKHRDIKLGRAMARAVFRGNTTQLKWAWSSAVNAPFYAPYYGFHVELEDGTTVLNYNEGFNTKMTDQEIAELGRRFKVDVLLAGMQLDFTADVARGVAALAPKAVVLYPPHEKFHEMMGVASEPWPAFAQAARNAAPNAAIYLAQPGAQFSIGRDGITSEQSTRPAPTRSPAPAAP